ncbi:hypothetical protein [Streptomyces litchfieldiae]|uniref:Uncharacterized protein n=1 Tax=Streptomyces litchfieldiae TaxID=3075543 RepID=A0ABU2N0W3_9ACTN|nr:hypothetical protein [Streptomyces sp. DSM 44938]MDT0347546.1 hypothetical protein [Streptomyces sp. DSM 44938]
MIRFIPDDGPTGPIPLHHTEEETLVWEFTTPGAGGLLLELPAGPGDIPVSRRGDLTN